MIYGVLKMTIFILKVAVVAAIALFILRFGQNLAEFIERDSQLTKKIKDNETGPHSCRGIVHNNGNVTSQSRPSVAAHRHNTI